MPNKGFVSITHVLAHIQKRQNGNATKSVSTPTAQTFDSCKMDQNTQDLKKSLEYALNHWRSHWPLMYRFAIIQLESGARVSEILQIHSTHVTTEGRIILHALKHGNDRVIRVPELREWLTSEIPKKRKLFMDLNRFAIHREYVKRGLYATFGNNTKRSTTHLMRHLVGLDLKQIKNSTHAIRHGLGQKTDQATDYYKAEIRG